MSPDSHLMHVEDVYKSYGPKLVLDNIDLAVSRGEFCTVVGPSGCGKSTLLRLMLGQETPTEGRILIDGRDVGPPSPDRGVVFQRYSLFPHLSVIDNVVLGKRLQAGVFGWRAVKAEAIAEGMEYLKKVGLESHARKYPHQLSGGMQQRVAIAQALIMRPGILMMDEPFGALDPETREGLQVYLLELTHEHKITTFFVTHDLEEAVFLGTRVLVLSQYYTDDRGDDESVNRGAKIVADHQLDHALMSTESKRSRDFGDLVEAIRREGFESSYRQHVNEFNLQHRDSFRTLTHEESSEQFAQ